MRSADFSAPIQLLRLVDGEAVEFGSNVRVLLFQNRDLSAFFELIGDPNQMVLLTADISAAVNVQFLFKQTAFYLHLTLLEPQLFSTQKQP